MKIRYAINARIPISRAHGLQVMKTCEALAKVGAEVELIVPRRANAITIDPYAFYAVEPLFTITYLPTLDLTRWGVPYAFALQTLVFTLSLARYLKRHPSDAVLYLRGEPGWLLPLFSRATFIWENHIRQSNRRAEARAVSRARGIVVVTEQYRKDLMTTYGLSESAILVAPDGVDLEQFASMIGKKEARAKLGLPADKTLILYAGSDAPWKGLRYLREASSLLPESYEVVFVGHMETHGAPARQRFVGGRPYEEMPLWLAAADVLVVTGDPSSDTARYYTSPMKLFEYMAASRPIVAADLPSFRDILSEDTAYFYTADDSKSLAAALERAATDPEAPTLAARARAKVEQYTWEKRAGKLLAFMRAF